MTGCAISADGGTVVSASDDRTLKIWSASTGALQQTLEGHGAPVTGCAISADGGTVVSASDDRTLKIWSASTGALQQTLEGHEVTG